jgi:hypothetical protein
MSSANTDNQFLAALNLLAIPNEVSLEESYKFNDSFLTEANASNPKEDEN